MTGLSSADKSYFSARVRLVFVVQIEVYDPTVVRHDMARNSTLSIIFHTILGWTKKKGPSGPKIGAMTKQDRALKKC